MKILQSSILCIVSLILAGCASSEPLCIPREMSGGELKTEFINIADARIGPHGYVGDKGWRVWEIADGSLLVFDGNIAFYYNDCSVNEESTARKNLFAALEEDLVKILGPPHHTFGREISSRQLSFIFWSLTDRDEFGIDEVKMIFYFDTQIFWQDFSDESGWAPPNIPNESQRDSIPEREYNCGNEDD